VAVFQPPARETKQIHGKNSLASPTPIVRDGKVYVHFGHMGTAALDLSGKVLWKQETLKYSPVHGNGASPALVNDLLVFSCDGAENPFLAALDIKTGAVRWKTPRNTPARAKFSFSTPLLIHVNGQQELISPASGFVGAYDPASGRELWRVGYGEGYSVVPRPVFANGLLFVSSGFDRPVMYAINPADAHGDAAQSHVVWKNPKGAPTTPSPLALGNELYLVSDGGIASCLDAKTGKAHWTERLGGGFSASPATAEGRIYFVSEAGVVFVIKAGTAYQLLARNELGERSLASPALIDDSIFIRTEAHLWRIGQP
jgi:outer membrane protein assembly factor BamB